MIVQDRKPLPIFARSTGDTFTSNAVATVPCMGMRRVVGNVKYSAAIVTVPTLEFSADGVNYEASYNFTADPAGTNLYAIDEDVQAWKYARITITAAGAGNNARGSVEILPAMDSDSGGGTTAGANPGAGHDAIHSSGTSAALAAGANTVTAYTVTAGKFLALTRLICRYTGTVAGVTLTAQVGGVVAGVPVGGLVSGQNVNLLEPGTVIHADPAETVQVLVTGATLADTITYSVQGDEMTI